MSHHEEYKWYAITTRYKCEKYVEKLLTRKGIEAYVPLIKRTKRYTRKVKHYDIPLISCYLFVRITSDDFVRVLETQHAVSFVRVGDNLSHVRESEIALMKRIVGEMDNVTAEPFDLVIGDQVEIISGGLTGIHGRLVAKQGKGEFVVALESLGFQLRMAINANMLRRTGRVMAGAL